MLGVTINPYDDPADALLRELGEELGVSDTYKKTPVGVYFGEPGAARAEGASDEDGGGLASAVRDPFFGGEGPDRTPCSLCGRCMVGCPHGSKNTLVKNYLFLAEKRGARVSPERTVIDIRPLGAGDGSEGYEVESIRSGAWVRRERQVHRARGVVVSAGPLGTNTLLQRCRLGGSLPRISDRLGELVRTNCRGDPGGHRAGGLPGEPDQAGGDQLQHLPRSLHPHRDRHLRRRRRLDAPALYAA